MEQDDLKTVSVRSHLIMPYFVADNGELSIAHRRAGHLMAEFLKFENMRDCSYREYTCKTGDPGPSGLPTL